MSSPSHDDAIVALATAQGIGALAVIRLSGNEAITIAQKVFRGKNLLEQPTHTLHLGSLIDGETIIDEVVVSIFKEPHSFGISTLICEASWLRIRVSKSLDTGIPLTVKFTDIDGNSRAFEFCIFSPFTDFYLDSLHKMRVIYHN